MTSRFTTAALGLALACGFAGAVLAADITTPIKGTDGETIGEAQLTGGAHGVLLQVAVKGLTPGWHGIHFHAVGDCSDAKFAKAGGHVNHDPKLPHGLLNPDGHDFGDLPNLYVAADGSGEAAFFSTFVRLKAKEGEHPALLDADGSALVIHANPDDYKTQPIGGAGARVGCAVIKQ